MPKISKVLVIDKNYQPIMIISWKKAFCLIFTNKASLIKTNNEIFINSPNQKFELPSVIQIDKVQMVKYKLAPNRWNVFARDNFKCGYCGCKYDSKKLSLDHIIPTSKGGKHCWENLITACLDCNQKKADKLLEELPPSFKLRIKPYAPTFNAYFLIRLNQVDMVDPKWLDFFPSPT